MVRETRLLQKIENEDMAYMDKLIALYYPDIFRYCLWHTPNRQTAEDAVQETFLKMARYFKKYVHNGNFRAYIYKIASNVCTDIWRKKKTEPLPEDLPCREQGFEEVESALDLKDLVQKLPEKRREIVLLRFAQNLSLREIAEIENIPLRTVQSRLRSALKQIEKDIRKGEK
ncbi:RNA polymerase sigma factor [Clostridium luticellarii]|jgi:RNA polymerase sigma-70 factor (ECF subfamily)|uniref:ECF RNA polymerase sigma factor SigW n=1 Tax=Clostridium luticellarii TaxID=1691940 RepID=A0A2T0BEZ2_9CLOT|nr:RNA polymerase sigma factor [Clostridium luticellarii]MCI1945173.1 RNA polymerase sigma factor [Clostridium luticellarii]MCI1968865.1 RNA polymerase sigma factor [Clostridium luticellarii]MCI1995651.1 RNA polymerase sigma factor [Clostridium luticellarii]MCI2040039.1 RNA polymerase sigma factor [Clostridium luticellarii]PRR82471.1 ECF RNA polymerase sigma factor SigW [Clostridium luticellarii]